MNKLSLSVTVIFLSLITMIGVGLNAEQVKPTSPNANQNTKVDEKYNIMLRDEHSGTDALAIPFDDSEVEDEVEINRDDKREVFSLPKPPSNQKK